MVGAIFEHTLVSNAQNGEDIRLMRAFNDQTDGFYVEIGGSDPKADSISRAFYDRGWHGIIVEPLPHQVAAFRSQRPRDTIVDAVCSSRGGSVTFYSVAVAGDGTGLSTMDRGIADRHRELDRTVTERTVRALTCAQILEGIQHVDFMVIDVEGAEEDVIRSLFETDVRPSVLVIEAIDPLTHEPAHQEWEQLVLEHGYLFSAFDGLNRFYASERSAELVDILAIPPNVTDNYIRLADMDGAAALAKERAEETRRLAHAQLVTDFLAEEARALRESRLETEARARKAEVRAKRLERELRAIRRSRSFRVIRKARIAAAPIRKYLKV
ncbi:MAG: FkbM family methyltransferase [Actinomycetes bacterium]